MAIVAIPIQPVENISGNSFLMGRLIEELTQTFKAGVPVALTAADGGVSVWDGATLTGAQASIIGISAEAASNLTATGTGAPTPMQPVTGVGAAIGTVANVPNQPSAKTIFHGAPANDGRIGFFLPADTVFSAVFGNNGNTAIPAVTDVGKSYGLTIDTAGNFWYVDKNKTGAAAAVKVIGLDLRDAPAAGTRVLFQLLPTVINVVA